MFGKGFSDKVYLNLRLKLKGEGAGKASLDPPRSGMRSRRNCEDKGREADRSLACTRKEEGWVNSDIGERVQVAG